MHGFWSRKQRKNFLELFPLSIRTFKIMFLQTFFRKELVVFGRGNEEKYFLVEVSPLSIRTFKIMFFADFFEKEVRGFWSRKRRKFLVLFYILR